MAHIVKKERISDNAQLMTEWNWEKNELAPTDLTTGSGKKVWWICSNGHEWQETPNNRTSGTSCPYCSNHRVLAGYNDLATTHPSLAKEWHPTKNENITPQHVSRGSNKKIWWICSKGHEYEATISNRSIGKGCPYCSGKRVAPGSNDLLSKFPHIAKEWHPTKNNSLSPEQISYGSTKEIWWLCPEGHEYISSPNKRTSHNRGCPYCSNRAVLSGVNDLETTFPQLAAEWCYTKNYPLTPASVFAHTQEKYWWTCPTCHANYFAAVANRASGTGCPECATRHHSSFAEQAIFFYIIKSYPDAINRYTDFFDNKMELDIYIPSLKIGIEYDGAFWHESESSFAREQRKYEYCKSLGVKIIRIREKPSQNDNSICDFVIKSEPYKRNIHILDNVLSKISDIIPLSSAYDVVKDEIKIKELYYAKLEENSLSVKMPHIAKEWDYDKNGDLLPSMISVSSTDRIWWKCSKGHSWKTSVYNRRKGTGCPFCSGNNVITGENDLKTLNPELAKEWDYNKNHPFTPETISIMSNKIVWWLCSNGHSWKTATYHRTARKTGCPYCANLMVWEGYNDLQTLHPQLAAEWNYPKNGDLTPNHIVAGSTKKVWWICPHGHEWEAQIKARVRGNGCPKCRNIKNSIRLRKTPETFSQEIKFANPNVEVIGSYVSAKEKILCRCLFCGKEWETLPGNLLKGHGCPKCAKQRKPSSK